MTWDIIGYVSSFQYTEHSPSSCCQHADRTGYPLYTALPSTLSLLERSLQSVFCRTSLRTEQITPVLSSCCDAIQASSIYREKQDRSALVLVYAVKLIDSLLNYPSRSRLSKDSCTSIEQVSSSWAPALKRPATFSLVTVCPIFNKSDRSTALPLSVRSGQLHLIWMMPSYELITQCNWREPMYVQIHQPYLSIVIQSTLSVFTLP